MKIRIVSYTDNVSGEGNRGYSFHASLKDAKQAIKESYHDAEIMYSCNVPLTKQAVLDFMNRYGGHPDNG